MVFPRQVMGLLVVFAVGTAPAADFERDVAPILLKRCLECHAGADASGGLDLTTQSGFTKGGKNGPAGVRIVERVSRGEMPPKKNGKSRQLPPAEIAALRAWIAGGASWPTNRVLDSFEVSTESRGGRDHWSLQPVQRPRLPSMASGNNPIDAFIQQKLDASGWKPAPPADPRTLIRRVYFDLVGMLPTFEDTEAFARDNSPDAYERLIDRLLHHPHYGERWGRHWLDVARYADTCGYERDQEKPRVWLYRDWVIRAFNENMPYDRFVIEQLAGDEVPWRGRESLIATGFLRLGTWNDEPNDPNEYKYERLEDMVGAASTAFLGLTVKCARCHDHKFDPIRQTDYYRIAAAFWAGPIEPGPRELLGGPDAKSLGEDVFGWTDRSAAPPPLHLLKKGDPHRPGPIVEPGHQSYVASLNRPVSPPPAGSRTTQRRLQFATWVTDSANPLTARVWVNRVWQYHFGSGLVRSPDNFGFTGDRPTHPELLDWLASELIASGWNTRHLHRLMLRSGTYRQSSLHPNQAEYAAVDAGNLRWWRAERRRRDAESLRDVLLQAAGRLDANRMGGPGFSPTLTAEATEGLSMKGNAWKASPPDEQRRRAVYMFTKRGLLPPLATAFDLPDTTLPCGRRDVTTVAPQALALLNNPFLHEQSAALAMRVSESAMNDADRIRRAWHLILGREPRDTEFSAAMSHLQEQRRRFAAARGDDVSRLALASLCHVLLNTNEFAYVD